MAKLWFEENASETIYIPIQFWNPTLTIFSKTKAVVTNSDGERAVYTGTGLGEVNGVRTGTVNTVRFYDQDNKLEFSITGGDFQFRKLGMDMGENFRVFEAGNDLILGTSHDDLLLYSTNLGNDTIRGFGGDDTIVGNPGRNLIDGGGGRDVLSYSYLEAYRGIFADLSKGTVDNAWGKVDKVTGIEEVSGTRFSDGFVGSNRNETFTGFKGNDYFQGGRGADQMIFGTGDGKDTFVDFGIGDDSVMLEATGLIKSFRDVKAFMHDDGDNAVFIYGDGKEQITFLNMHKADFVKADFEFAF